MLQAKMSLTRRTFLRQMSVLGPRISAGLLVCGVASSLAGCGQKSLTLNWLCEKGRSGDYESFKILAQVYNVQNSDQVTVVPTASENYSDVRSKLARSHADKGLSYDIVSIDVVWVREFASKGWIMSLEERWPPDRSKTYLSKPLQAVKYRGKIWGAPLHTDIGILYYRTRLPNLNLAGIERWDVLENRAQAALQQGFPIGFTWQAQPKDETGGINEALICNFVEILTGYNGKIFDDPYTPAHVLINSAETRDALGHMYDWVRTISPDATNDSETQSTTNWIKGNAAYMRNWPAAVIDSLDHRNSLVTDSFDVTHLPLSIDNGTGGCLGGWQMAINSAISSDRQDAAWKFMSWMLQPIAQRYLAIKENFPVTLEEMYSDPAIQQFNPYYGRIKNYVEQSQSRPTIPQYQSVRAAIGITLNTLLASPQLTDQLLDDALLAMENQLKAILKLYALTWE